MAQISIANVINVSVQVPPAGLAPYSINNLVCFTKDTPVVSQPNPYSVYASASAVAADWGTGSNTYAAALAVFGQSPNILTGGGFFIVIPMLSLETLASAIVRAESYTYYGGFSYAYTLASGEAAAAATVATTERKLFFVSSHLETDLQSGGLFYTIQSATETQARCLFYTDSSNEYAYRWAYAGRAMSVNFSASNTTMTMQLKQLAGVPADSGLTQTMLAEAKTVGADIYASVAGRSSVLSYGANGFYDDIYNLNWIVGALQVAGFNYLATTSTKVPQTEAGMDGLKGAYRAVCGQAVANQFVAPGKWTSADTFGNPVDFTRNISDFGYYIYSAPVAAQLPSDRANRQAPAVQIAIKYAGAIHTSDVLVYLNQ